jgi:hypothetical protein
VSHSTWARLLFHPYLERIMAKIKSLTSMARGGESIAPNQEVDLPETEAIALCVNGLAEPIGWELPTDEPAGDESPKKGRKKSE